MGLSNGWRCQEAEEVVIREQLKLAQLQMQHRALEETAQRGEQQQQASRNQLSAAQVEIAALQQAHATELHSRQQQCSALVAQTTQQKVATERQLTDSIANADKLSKQLAQANTQLSTIQHSHSAEVSELFLLDKQCREQLAQATQQKAAAENQLNDSLASNQRLCQQVQQRDTQLSMLEQSHARALFGLGEQCRAKLAETELQKIAIKRQLTDAITKHSLAPNPSREAPTDKLSDKRDKLSFLETSGGQQAPVIRPHATLALSAGHATLDLRNQLQTLMQQNAELQTLCEGLKV